MKKHGKYETFAEFLSYSVQDDIILTFRQIELLIGEKLPESARIHSAWWSNATTSHPHADAWLLAGYKTHNLSLDNETVSFIKQK